MNVLNDKFIVQYDVKEQSLLIVHPDEKRVSNPLVSIRAETLSKMNFVKASQFLGERLILLIPQLRERYKDDIAKPK